MTTGDLSYMTPESFNDAVSNIGSLLAAASASVIRRRWRSRSAIAKRCRRI